MARPELCEGAGLTTHHRPAAVNEPKRRNAFAQALFDAKARGAYVPDVELVWFDRADISAGCHNATALLFAYEHH